MSELKRPEILAPAGSKESLYAAVKAGCDAVYIGGSRFGARAYADNPGEDTMIEAIEYCHLHGVKIYMTVNTLLKDREIEQELYDYMKPYYEAGLDAAIVQDTGVMRLLHKWFPKLHIHASTQMTLTQGMGVNFMKKYGVNRIVPARELTIEELEIMRKDTDLEMEVFVHGALCYCYSGQCLFSSMLGGRSGNRGRCAQPCRMQYSVDGKKAQIGEYVLSPKELSNLPYVGRMIEAGIDSFKIEGRMKRPEYTAFVTAMFKKYVDLYMELGKEKYDSYMKKHSKELEKDMNELAEVYNRNGFTQGYLEGKAGVTGCGAKYGSADMLSSQRPKHGGMRVGTVLSAGRGNVTYQLEKDILPQDVVEFRDSHMRTEYEYTIGAAGKKGEIIKARYQKGSVIKAGDSVYRTKNAALLDKIRENYIDIDCKLKIQGEFYAKTGERATLVLRYEDTEICYEGNVCEAAQKLPTDEKTVRKSITQTGNSEFEFESLEITLSDAVFLPVGVLKNIRREALDKLREEIIGRYRRTVSEACVEKELTNHVVTQKSELSQSQKVTYIASVMTQEQLEEVLSHSEIEEIYIKSEVMSDKKIGEAVKQCKGNGKKVFLVLPHIFRKHISEKEREKFAAGNGVFLYEWDGYVVKNFEEYNFLKDIIKIDAAKITLDAGMYVMNESAYQLWNDEGVTHFTMPYELTAHEMKKLACKDGMEMIIYSHIPAMVSAQCVRYNTAQCAMTSSGSQKNMNSCIILKDKRDREFTIVNYCKYCYNTVYMNTPLSLKKYTEDIIESGIKRLRYDFTIEDASQVRSVLSYDDIRESFEGHYMYGVE